MHVAGFSPLAWTLILAEMSENSGFSLFSDISRLLHSVSRSKLADFSENTEKPVFSEKTAEIVVATRGRFREWQKCAKHPQRGCFGALLAVLTRKSTFRGLFWRKRQFWPGNPLFLAAGPEKAGNRRGFNRFCPKTVFLHRFGQKSRDFCKLSNSFIEGVSTRKNRTLFFRGCQKTGQKVKNGVFDKKGQNQR